MVLLYKAFAEVNAKPAAWEDWPFLASIVGPYDEQHPIDPRGTASLIQVKASDTDTIIGLTAAHDMQQQRHRLCTCTMACALCAKWKTAGELFN